MARNWLLCAVLLCVAACDDARETAWRDTNDVPRAQLPRTVLPNHYRLDLEIVPDLDRFSATAVIDVTIAEAVDHIWLHGRDLDVTVAILELADGQRLEARFTQVTADGVARLDLPETVNAASRLVLVRLLSDSLAP